MVFRRYGKALFELCDEQNVEEIGAQLGAFASAMEKTPELKEAIDSPSVQPEQRRAAIEAVLKLLKIQDLARTFVLYLLDRGRMHSLSGILGEFEQRVDAAHGRIRAEVRSATPLDTATIQRMEAALKSATGANEVILQSHVDDSLIGGTVTRVGNKVLDNSIRHQIESIRDHLLVR
jgi:F-type H+-transporting ATPase subunit delta